MDVLFFRRVQCPYCGEPTDLQLDGSAGQQRLIEDCSVCCRPIELHLYPDGEAWRLEVHRDDE